jgi:diguanylate cyclase (GGDEF)-like protein
MATQGRFGGESIELNLRDAPRRGGAPSEQADALRPVLDQALGLIADCAAACGDADGPIGMIQDCRAALSAAGSPASLADRCVTALEACRQFIARSDATESARRRQMVELVELVRDAMTTLTGETAAFDAGLTASAARFDAVLALDNLTQIKVQLTREVGELKRLTEERQTAWTATLNGFSSRITQLEHQLADSEQQATSDPLTGLANRGVFDRTLKELAGKASSHFVLALADVDDFKNVNDTHGHLAGDEVLNLVATCLRSAFRNEDVVARHGGDEFAVLIKDMTLFQAETRMCGALDSIAANRPSSEAGAPIVFTLSVGLAEFSPGDTTRSILQRADEGLYEAKRSGKNRVVKREQAYLKEVLKRRK